MLTPRYLQNAPQHLVEIWQAVENSIVEDMCRRISREGLWNPSTDFQYQKLREMGRTYDEVVKMLSQALGKSKPEIERLLTDAATQAIKADQAIYAKAGLSAPSVAVSAGLQMALNGAISDTQGLFENITHTTANTATKQFEHALDRAWLQVKSGAFSHNQAIQIAVKDLSEKGIKSIEYPSGHVDYLDVAVRRATLTGINQASLKCQDRLAEEMGCDLVDVTAHSGARTSDKSEAANHAGWQGKRYSRNGTHAKHPSLAEKTGYGTGEGLGGWNCRHNMFPAFEGMPPQYSQEELDEMNAPKYWYKGEHITEEKAQSIQRYNERNIRSWKREFVGMEAAGQDSGKAAVKLKQWQARQDDFLKQTGLKRQADREQLEGFGSKEGYRANKQVEIIQEPWKHPGEVFAKNLDKNNVPAGLYRESLEKRFAAADDRARKVYAKYVPELSVENGKSTAAPHYASASKKITMSYRADLTNTRGVGATYYHEHGHLVDHAGGQWKSTESDAFAKALQKDGKQYIINYTPPDGMSASVAISDELRKSDLYSAVSDLLGGITQGKISGGWGHDQRYWKRSPDMIPREAFAHMFEAQFSKKRYAIIKKYFPTALQEFEIILKEMIL